MSIVSSTSVVYNHAGYGKCKPTARKPECGEDPAPEIPNIYLNRNSLMMHFHNHNPTAMKFNSDSNNLPKRSELPPIAGAPEGAAWFWGENDEVCFVPRNRGSEVS